MRTVSAILAAASTVLLLSACGELAEKPKPDPVAAPVVETTDGMASEDEARSPVNDDRSPVNDDRSPVNDDRTRVNDDRSRVNDDRSPVNDDRTAVGETR